MNYDNYLKIEKMEKELGMWKEKLYVVGLILAAVGVFLLWCWCFALTTQFLGDFWGVVAYLSLNVGLVLFAVGWRIYYLRKQILVAKVAAKLEGAEV